MILDFDNMTPVAVEGFKGGKGTVQVRKYDDPAMGTVVRLSLPAGAQIGLHTHEGNCEIVYVLAGTGVGLYDDTSYPIAPGSILYCPEHHAHAIHNTGEETVELLGVLPNSVK